MKFPIVNILTLFIACCSMCACSTLRPGEFIPTEGKIQWIAADGKTNLILFGDYEQIKDKHKWRIPHPCRSTSRETTLLMAQTSAEPYIGLTVKQSRLNMLVYSSGTVILKDTIMNSQNGMPLRMQILHLSAKQGPLTEIRYIWENDPKAIQFHVWSNRENQDALLRESETIMNSFAIK